MYHDIIPSVLSPQRSNEPKHRQLGMAPPADTARYKNHRFPGGEYCLSNDSLICFLIVCVVTNTSGEEAWTPVRNAHLHTSSRLGRLGATSAGAVAAVAINSRAPRHVGDPGGRSRWPCSSMVTGSL